MKARLLSIIVVAFMVLVMLPLAWSTNQPAQAEAPLVNCQQVRISPSAVRIQCSAAGIIVLNTVVQLPTVPPVTITVPTQTVTVRPPQATQTVRVPGPAATENVQVPGPTQTITEPGETLTVTETATANTTVSPSGQAGTTPATIEPPDEDNGDIVFLPAIKLSTPEAVGLSILALMFIAGLILLGMYGGYYLGFKDSDKAEAKFLKSILG